MNPIRSISRRAGALAALSATILLSAGAAAPAQEVKAGDLTLVQPWARATPAGATVAGGFVEIRNTGAEGDRLVAATVPFAERVEIHEMAVVDGVMTMRHLPDGLDVPAGGSLTLKPGSYHLMFMELKEPLVADTVVSGTMSFQKAGTVAVEFAVEPIGAAMPAAADHMGGHGQ